MDELEGTARYGRPKAGSESTRLRTVNVQRAASPEPETPRTGNREAAAASVVSFPKARAAPSWRRSAALDSKEGEAIASIEAAEQTAARVARMLKQAASADVSIIRRGTLHTAHELSDDVVARLLVT